MSRISQTFSILSNLSSSPLEADTGRTALEDKKIETITEQFLPRKQDAMFGDQFIFQTASLRQRINAKLVLLAPSACDTPPFAKSVIYLSSLSGSVSATVFRQHPGGEPHLFCLYIFAREADVKVTLPSLFRGIVKVSHDGFQCQRGRTRYCRAFRERIRCGFIKLDSCAPVENDDEVYIHTEGRIKLRLMPSSANDGGENAVSRMGRHVRRILG